jgi:DNA-binding beta-propeller fold protein YncE
VADAEGDRIQMFGSDGVFLGQWGALGSGAGQFANPESVAVDGDGNVYVADRGNARVEKFDPAGGFLGQWGTPGSGPGQLSLPEGIAVDGFNDVYVADAGNDRIVKFAPDGTFLLQWGATGAEPGQFDGPDSVASDRAGNVYVADSENDRVQKFTDTGVFLDEWGGTGDGPGEFGFPVAVEVAQTDRVYVADSANDRVEGFDRQGRFLFEWGGPGSAPGQFESPTSLAATDHGTVYVADAGNDRIQSFSVLPDPGYGRSVNLLPIAGRVSVRLPGRKHFSGLDSGRQLPVGTVVDADAGRVRLTSAKGPGAGSQSADFFEGTFRILQPRRGRPITVLKLENEVACGTGGGAGRTATASGRRRGLWGSGKGSFRSEGRHGSATVRGTIWWAQDRCDGTLFRVKRGVVTIRDFTRHRTLKLHRGQRYLAPAG